MYFSSFLVNCLSRVQRAFKRNELNCTTACPPPCRWGEESVRQLTTDRSFSISTIQRIDPWSSIAQSIHPSLPPSLHPSVSDCWSVPHSFIHSCIHSFIQSFIPSFVRSFVLFVHSFIHSVGQSFKIDRWFSFHFNKSIKQATQ